ncbi:flagellar biosynthetic protein FliR [Cognatilysobacter lacus]|uniref:Flagellar biosynthetic protein FliR n=1 Tax=Cognatilysobacter lacus TaxID=1643323 RepID=A0A5D8Z2D6_9GAMM|nr:flagellar biosynthetic protein FliR [Lysobacter lacus]TZF86864.1 flagellar biosynthetic protein FliR [Lysobacter lacus]
MDPVTLTTAQGLNLFGMLASVLWYALRIGAAIQALPMVGGRGIPARSRLVLTIAIAAALSQMLPAPPPAGVNAATFLAVGREFAMGIAIGLMLRIAFEAGEVAGQLVSQGMGLASATLANPTSGESSPVVAQWFFLSFGLVFFASDGHLALIQLLFDSYGSMPVGAPIHDWGAFVSSVPQFFGVALRTGLLLALPVMMALLAVNVAVGVLSRAAQQLSPMSLGFPIALLVGLVLLMSLARELQGPVQRLFGEAFQAARALTG